MRRRTHQFIVVLSIIIGVHIVVGPLERIVGLSHAVIFISIFIFICRLIIWQVVEVKGRNFNFVNILEFGLLKYV